MLSLTEMFASLGAPLANQRWSWGAERPSDGAVFLRVWQDESKKLDGRRSVRLTANSFFADKLDNLGNAERLRHVNLIRSGRSAYLVMCVAVDPRLEPRTISKFNGHEVFVGGVLADFEGDAWIELASRRPVSEVRPNKSLERTREG
jgi:hypothetical protein